MFCCVLFQSRVIEEELQKQNIPFVVPARQPFWCHNEIQDMVAVLRVIAEPTQADAALLQTVVSCLHRLDPGKQPQG